MNDKLKSLQKLMSDQFKTGELTFLENDDSIPVEVVPTDIYSLDRAVGIGGVPKGRMIEIFGPESAGKSTMALYMVSAFQKAGLIAAYIDLEHTLNLQLAKIIGVNTEELIFSQPDSAEKGLELIEKLVRSGNVGIIIVDSVAAMTPEAEIQGEYGESHMGKQAKLMSQAMRKLIDITDKTKTTIIWVNQVRMKIGVFFGSNETTTGGLALKFYCSQRFEVRKGETIKEKDKVIGHNIIIKIVKNKLAAPFTRCEFPLIYGKGIDRIADIFEVASQLNIITKAGSTYSFRDEKIAVGRGATINKIADNPELIAEIIKELDNVRETKEALQDMQSSDKEDDKE